MSKNATAYEQKVRSIYDALDSRNWKSALKLCQQALAKFPGDDLVRVLKAIGLDRSGSREEANQLVDEVLAGQPPPVDEQVLRLAGMVLRASGRMGAITSMYEVAADAAARMPGGGELALTLLHEVFGAHVRESSFVKQQQVAMRLSKAAAAAAPGGTVLSAERYGWWVVLSLLLQARAALQALATGAPPPPGRVPAVAMEPVKVLALAEGMLARQLSKDGRLGGYEALMLYVDVLLAQGKVAAAQDLVSGPQGAACLRLPAERLQLRAVLAALAGDCGGAAVLLREGLRHQPDDWGALCLLLDCMLPGTAVGAGCGAAASGAPATFTPRHPLILISGGLAEQLPPRGAPVPADGGASSEAFLRAEEAIKELVELCDAAARESARPPQHETTAVTAGGTGAADADGGVRPGAAKSGGKAGGGGAGKKKGGAKGGGGKEPSSSGGGASSGDKAGSGSGDGGKAEGSGVKPMVMRGPDLALVELAMRRHLASTAAASPSAGAMNGDNGAAAAMAPREAAVVEAILSYYRKYGSLVSCAVDLRSYVSQLSEGAAAALAEALALEAGADGANPEGSAAAASGSAAAGVGVAALRRRVCAAQLCDDAGLPVLRSPQEAVARSRELLELFSTARPLQVGLDERERGAADELPVLAAAALVTAATLAPSDAAAVPYMLAAYGELCDAVQNRPYGAGMRISLSALAGLLGAPSASAAHLARLELKHIQMDSLGGHLLLPPLLAWPLSAGEGGSADAGAGGGGGAAGEPAEPGKGAGGAKAALSGEAALLRALRDSRALFEDHSRDAGETLFTAYNHGMYTKVLEFTAFRERLAASHTLALVRSEAAITDCMRALAAAPAPDATVAAGDNGAAAAGALDAVGAEALQSAAAAAAGGLQTEQLPTAGSLRFNADLSVRPAWLPPCPAGPSMQPLEWWRARARGDTCGQGYGRRWWSATSSAESACPAAARWREAQAAFTAHRWLLPACMAGALGAPGQQGSQLRTAVERLRTVAAGAAGLAAEAHQPCSRDRGQGQDGEQGVAAAALPGSEDLRRLDVQLYEAALAVQECLASAAPAGASGRAAEPAAALSEADADAACSALASLAGALSALTQDAAAGIAESARAAGEWGGLLPGGALAALSHLLREPLAVATACLQSWRASLGALRSRAGEGSGGLGPGAQRLAGAVKAAAEGMASAARAAAAALADVDAASTAAGSAAAAAALATAFLQAQGHPPSASSNTATTGLVGLISEQRATVAALGRLAKAAAEALAIVSLAE